MAGETDDNSVIDSAGLDALVSVLGTRGFRVLGPTVRDGAIVHAPARLGDFPVGWHDEQSPGSYLLRHDEDDEEVFGWAVGPDSWKSSFFPPSEHLWRARQQDGGVVVESDTVDTPLAIVGTRPCELAALTVLDGVLGASAHADQRYLARRRDTFVVVVECGSPAGTCFCTSMGSGPAATGRFDLALTELLRGETTGSSGANEHRFLVRSGSEQGAEILAAVPHRKASQEDVVARDAVLDRARAAIGRRLEAEGLPGLLARSIDHPRWQEVAQRCLSCGNCTMVCPTCFCSDIRDVTDLTGTATRRRTWSSCFDLDHSHLHGGPVRTSIAARYRQWMTHKLSTWHDQFGTSGCVGCGRCIAWCPVGIDITEEAAVIRASTPKATP